MPMAKRDAAPAPVARMSGTMAMTMAAVVIRIGRRRIAAASSIAARRPNPFVTCRWLA